MNKKILPLIAMFMIFFSNSLTFGQNSDSPKDLKVFGLGMHIEQFKLTDITMDISTTPANKILLAISPTNHFRLEPEIGFNYLNNKEEELKDKSIHVGIGVFGMFQKGKTNFYGGIKFEYANISNEYNDWNTGAKQTTKMKRLTIGPAIGAEFFFGEHFSFGGEIGLKYMNLKSENNQFNVEDIKQDYITTDSGLLLRFYF
ncbi:MAG: outer membrane beta-barrel protein [Bacteroidota bacterium]